MLKSSIFSPSSEEAFLRKNIHFINFNDISPAQYEDMLRIMMLLVSLAMMRCLPQTLGEADTISEGNIIGRSSTSFVESKHHSKRPLLSGRQKRSFCWRRRRDLNPRYPFGVYTISNRARSASYATSPYVAVLTA